MLKRIGIRNVSVVKEQENPDGNFPTCPYPNPEIKQVFECAVKMTEQEKADLLLATDPDCDRVGIAVLNNGEYKHMTGNEVGVLLAEYLLSRRQELGTLPKNAVVVKSFVTTDLVDVVCKKYGASVKKLLTGFKYIGEYITELEAKGVRIVNKLSDLQNDALLSEWRKAMAIFPAFTQGIRTRLLLQLLSAKWLLTTRKRA